MIQQLESFLQSGDERINNPDYRFLSKNAGYIFNRQEDSNWLFIDKLLYKWGIMHFHPSKEQRCNDLLYAILDDE